MSRFNGLSLKAHRKVFKGNGEGLAFVNAFYFGNRQGNDYDALSPDYGASDLKPDKQYSILPTVLDMVGECQGLEIIDLGCGTGFFTNELAKKGASWVWGVDNSPAQIRRANELCQHENVRFVEADIFVGPFADTNVIVAPFVANYAAENAILRYFFEKCHKHLSAGGKLVLVVDLPNGANLKRFGAVKTLKGGRKDGATIEIELFKEGQSICTLNAKYYLPKTIERLLKVAGFGEVRWRKPLVSEEGIQAMGADFWKGYADNPELGYITAVK